MFIRNDIESFFCFCAQPRSDILPSPPTRRHGGNRHHPHRKQRGTMQKRVPSHITTTANPADTPKSPARTPVHAAIPPDAHKAILSSLDVTIPPNQTPTGYGLALAALVAYLLVIGAIYVALVSFLAWLLVWHVYQAFASLS